MEATTQPSTEKQTSARGVERTSERRAVPPAVDIFENGEQIVLIADVPGVSLDGVTVDLHKDRLTLTARRADDAAVKGPDYHRVFQVPQGIDGEKISAQLAFGVLTVTLPKSAALRPRRVQITAG